MISIPTLYITACMGIVPPPDAAYTSDIAYPEDSPTPKFLTNEESRFIRKNPITAPRGVTSPPVGPIHCVAEYEPMEGVLLAWEGWSAIVAQMAAHITTTGNADAIIVIDQTGEDTTASALIASYGGDLSRVKFVTRTIDTIWIRDYGPRYIYEGECRAIIDHTYNRPRPNDNDLNNYFATVKSHKLYEIPLVHGGGNFHLNGSSEKAWSTELIANENAGITQSQIQSYWQSYQNLNVTITGAFPTSIDYTQHIDMWMCWASNSTCVISDWPYNSGSIQDVICDTVASNLQLQGFTIVRIPARSLGWTHYTYANSVICNDLVLVPSYSNSQVTQHNAAAIAAWQAACPNKTIVSVPCEDIVSSAGVMHCICMHIPLPIGGVNPTAFLQNPRGGATYNASQLVPITWLTDDDVEVTSVDIEFSSDGGVSWQPISLGASDDGFHIWQIPDVNTSSGVVRITAIDADGNTGANQGDSLFTIQGSAIPGDVNGDGLVNVTDILAVVDTWGPCGISCPADLNQSGNVDVVDLLIVIGNW